MLYEKHNQIPIVYTQALQKCLPDFFITNEAFGFLTE